MTKDEMLALWEAWEGMDRASQNVTTALPSSLTERVAELERARLAMRRAMNDQSRRIRAT